MSVTTDHIFDTTLHKTNEWLKAVMKELNWSDRHRAYHALRAVLHTLRDRLPNGEAVDLGAQLPLLIKGMYYDGWTLRSNTRRLRKKDDFLASIAADFEKDPAADAEQIARAVFRVIADHVTPGETKDVKLSLPEELRELWP